MFARRIAVLLILVGLVAAVWALGAATPPKRAATPVSHAGYPDTFAIGPGREIAERTCVFCHSPMLVTQQHKDSTGWEKTLATMEKWGLPLSPAEHDSLRTYLLATQGPRAAAKP